MFLVALFYNFRLNSTRIEHEHGPEISVTLPEFGSYATLHAGIYAEQTSIAWCRWMVEQFERHARHAPEQEV